MSQRLIIALATLASLAALQSVGHAQPGQQSFEAPNGQTASASGTWSETTPAGHRTGSPASVDAAASHEKPVLGSWASSDPPLSDRAHSARPAIVVDKTVEVDNVAAADQTVVIAGHVRRDVVAYRSDITILPGAFVGGHVIAFGGRVNNQAGSSINVVLSNTAASSVFNEVDSTIHLLQTPTGIVQSADETSTRNLGVSGERPGWFESQFGLLVLGMLGASILIIAAPRATQEVAESIALRPARSLTIGFISALILTLVLGISFVLTKGMPKLISLMWSPFGTVIALAAGTLLAFGWLTGMRFAGDRIARTFGRPATSDGLYARMSLGLVSFFLANSLLGTLNPNHTLGIAGLTLEFAIALMGLGAAIVTRLGKAPDQVAASRLR